MENTGLHLLKNRVVTSISAITVVDKDGKWLQDDTFIIECDGILFRILIDHTVEVYELKSLENLYIKGDYDLKNIRINTNAIQTYNQKIGQIINYLHGQHYLFGSKFLNPEGSYIFGFCYGFDEIILLEENDFATMVRNYENPALSAI